MFWPTGAEGSLWISPNFLRICGGCRLPFLISVDRPRHFGCCSPFLLDQRRRRRSCDSRVTVIFFCRRPTARPSRRGFQPDRRPARARARGDRPTRRGLIVAKTTRIRIIIQGVRPRPRPSCPSRGRKPTRFLKQSRGKVGQEACSHAPAKLCGFWTSPLVRHSK